MRYKSCIFLFLLLSCFISAQNNPLRFTNISVKDGLSQNTVIRILQDRKGMMWFCTRDGLNRYDGTTFRVYRSSINVQTTISSSDVTCISENKDGSFWIGTHSGLNHFDSSTDKFQRYFHDDKTSSSLSSSAIKHLLTDRSDNTWIGTTHGLDLFDKKNQKFKHIYSKGAVVWLIQRADGTICFASVQDGLFIYNPRNGKLKNYRLPPNDHIYTIFEDSKQNLWAGMWSSSLKKLNPANNTFEQVPLKTKTGESFDHEQIGYMVEYKPGSLMLATRKGLLIYDTKEKLLTQRLNSKNSQLRDEKVITLYKDRAGSVWVGSWNGGIDFYSRYSNYFSLNTPSIEGKGLVGSINSLSEIDGQIWLATDNGLFTYNRQNNTYQTLSLNLPTSSNEVRFLFKDNDKLWVNLYAGGLYVMNLKTKKIEKTISSFNYGYVKAMIKDEAGNYWIAAGTNDPFVRLDGKTNQLQRKFEIKGSKQLFAPINVQDVLLEKGQTIWIGTRSDGLYCYNYQTKELRHFLATAELTSMSNNHVSALFRDSKKNLWIGTFGGGVCLYNYRNNSFKSFDHKVGLLNDAVCGMMEDRDNSLWISTLEGISHFSPAKKTFDNYNSSNGYPIQETVPRSAIRLSDNSFAVGGVNGFVLFNPSRIVKNPIVPNVVISRFKVWADNVSDVESTSESVNPDKKVKLKYYQAAFTIYFAALNYIYPNKNQYAYKLDGFDRNWNSVINERSATYTNIPPGHYTFRVKACNNDGLWNEAGTSFDIQILPPPWKTWWAYLLYFILIASVLGGFIYYILNKQKLETDITIKQFEQRNLEENHQMKVRLFTNFSHELRTPLTLIIGPLNEILSKVDLPLWIRPRLELIFKNAQRLLWLVNQLMDFRKLESGFMKPNVVNVDFQLFMNDIITTFQELAVSKEINLSLQNNSTNKNIWVDPILIEKVFFNILSNAFKHTASKGNVEIRIEDIDSEDIKQITTNPFRNTNAILIDILDNGTGIEKHEVENIFEPFYQAHNHEGVNIYGTGIGLNLCKGIIELHSGIIWAESELEKGSTFRILLPTGNSHFSSSELKNTQTSEHDRSLIVDLPNIVQPDSTYSIENEISKKDHFTVLIVEDNEDVRHYIKSLLIDSYKIIEAQDCAIGCDLAIEFVPDLIISDIMTPNMSGIELCSKLKNNDVTNHIPIILLTALSGTDQIKEGIISLADDYIVKPFNPELLQLRVNNLIAIRKKIRDAYKKNGFNDSFDYNLPSTEDRFMSKVFDYIKSNIDNPDLRIDSFSEDIGMSRVQFYRKIKSITGKTPSSIILELRMNTASKLLKKKDFNINEIAYKVGFNDSSYFGKCFKAYFGVTPGDFNK